jgi:hypothetical protein
MKKIRHSKYKNTGLIFEVLTRQMTQDVLNGQSKNPASLQIIREFFGKNTEIKKELELYRILSERKLTDEHLAHKLIDATSSARKGLNESRLNRQKYNLIKELKQHYLLDTVFEFRIPNYKTLASIYTLFEYSATDNPSKYINAESTIKSHLIQQDKKQPKKTGKTTFDILKTESKDTQSLAYFIAVDKFNTKYNSFNIHQKKLLHEVIYNQQNTQQLREFILESVGKLSIRLKKLIRNVDAESTTKIKLKEIFYILENYKKVRRFNDNHIMALLRYYDLEHELKKLR